jgi:pimeloyl-ACP methyl ester carboxylesterase
MTSFVLVHGAWHGAWCWERTIAALRALGHQAVAVDLPGHGDDPTPRETVTLDAYAASIETAVRTRIGRSVLVGHSMGGMAISAAAERCADRLEGLVYLAAFLPQDGESLLSIEGRNPKPAVPPALVVEEGAPTVTLDPAKIPDLFYHDCSDEDVARAMERLTPQPLAPFAAPAALTADRFGAVPRSYVACAADRAVCIELQRDMIAASPCARVVELDASHSPFLSMPDRLAAAIAG